MEVFRSSVEATGRLRRPAVCIGNFDGVHLGHRALFAHARQLAGDQGQVVALTFDPHPARFFNPQLAPPLISTEPQKLALLDDAGLDAVVLEPFSAELAALSPRDFVQQVLVDRLAAAHVVVGRNFVFGCKRAGNLEVLQSLGQELGFEGHGLDIVHVQSMAARSTKVREFLMLGRVIGASVLLGREYRVEGTVVMGKQRGRTIGIPTANIEMTNEILPRRGVYAGRVRLPDGQVAQAVINIGTNPTFEQAAVFSFEVHILDYAGDLYGQRLAVQFTQRLRDEQRFSSVEQLVAAIAEDIKVARQILE